ncbi:MAG: HYExAFE family protein [Oligoflexia bacterium]|nr:HYExAFE family protein [Oligoflexia bacterium]MBF0365331.1 HYExAFE family protein [Oligoflexia bacterium]
MKRKGNHSHYENAVEAYLREKNIPYIATNEGQKVVYNDSKIKNFDLVLPGKMMHMVDIKGRKFGYPPSTPKNFFENWILQDDAESLKVWNSVSSNNQQAYLLYAYCCPDSGDPLPKCFEGNTFFFEGRAYAFFMISIQDYLSNSKRRSLKPPTVCVSRKLFSNLLRPLSLILIENKI